MDGLFEKDQMALYEKMLFEHNDDDWFVSDYNLELIGVMEYRIYEKECSEVVT